MLICLLTLKKRLGRIECRDPSEFSSSSSFSLKSEKSFAGVAGNVSAERVTDHVEGVWSGAKMNLKIDRK
jgi:hypothetical protein